MRSSNKLMDVSECRDLRHSWTQVRGWAEGRVFIRVMGCARCGTTRKEHLNSRGVFTRKPIYSYPSTYKVDGGPLTPEERAWLRILNLRVFMYNDNEKDAR